MGNFIKLTEDEKGNLLLKMDKGQSFRNVKVVETFPQDKSIGYVSILSAKDEELCLITNIASLDEESRMLILRELVKRYFVPNIKRILDLEVEFGISYWIVDTDKGKREFIMRLIPENFVFISQDNLLLIDASGNRFQIPDCSSLDKKSQALLELVL